MVEAAAKLALSVLPKAYALTAAESQKALHQCKEQSSEMLEKACKAVEQVIIVFLLRGIELERLCAIEQPPTIATGKIGS